MVHGKKLLLKINLFGFFLMLQSQAEPGDYINVPLVIVAAIVLKSIYRGFPAPSTNQVPTAPLAMCPKDTVS